MSRRKHNCSRSRKRRSFARPFAIEALEHRIVLATLEWVGLGAGSNFNTQLNWADTAGGPARVPGIDDTALFDDATPKNNVLFNDDATNFEADIAKGDLTFNLNGHTYSLGGMKVGTVAGASLTIQNDDPVSAAFLRTGGGGLEVGAAEGVIGTLSASGPNLFLQIGGMIVGIDGGLGTAELTNGVMALTDNKDIEVGGGFGTVGALNVDRSNLILAELPTGLPGFEPGAQAGNLYVGNMGNGSMAIQNRAQVYSGSSIIGNWEASAGAVHVASESSWIQGGTQEQKLLVTIHGF